MSANNLGAKILLNSLITDRVRSGANGSFRANCRMAEEPTLSMTLQGYPSSDSALAAIDHLFVELGGPSLGTKSRAPFRLAIAAIVFDLLRLAADATVDSCFRPMNAASFSGKRIGVTNTKRALERMKQTGLILLKRGHYDRDTMTGMVTRVQPSAKLFTTLASYGPNPENHRSHFERIPDPLKPSELAFLNSASKWRWGKRISGRPMPIDLTHSVVADRIERLQRINAFTSMQKIEGAYHDYFLCIFNQGDVDGHGYQQGGRLWSQGSSYQGLSKAVRSGIIINGQPTVELDIGSSHFTIYLAVLDIAFDGGQDLYAIPDLPRFIVKWMVNLTLSLKRNPSKWPHDFELEFRAKHGSSLSSEYPFSKVQTMVFEKYPFLKDRASVELDWSDLQYIESEIIIRTVDRLNSIGITALPIHDSVIVPAKDTLTASYALMFNFKEVTGIVPIIKTNYQLLIA